MPRNPTLSNLLRSRSKFNKTLGFFLSSMKFLSRFPNPLTSLQKSLRPFSSTSPFPLKSLTNRRGDAIEDSPVYLRSKLRRPPTLKQWNLRQNSCSFIGTVTGPVKIFGGPNPRSDAYTMLEVKTPSRDSDPSSSSSPSFKILLVLRDKLSEISRRYLKPNDYIYVCGTLNSSEKVDASGKRENFYKVVVTELNFVTRNNTNQISLKLESAGSDLTVDTSSAGEIDQEKVSLDREERNRARLRLWQVFFASPREWWDNRRGKRNPRMPDFKHKDTKECLWINPDDPPWVRKQLQLYDSSMGRGQCSRADAFGSKLGDFV